MSLLRGGGGGGGGGAFVWKLWRSKWPVASSLCRPCNGHHSPPGKGNHHLPQVVKQAFGEGWSFFTYSGDAARKMNGLTAWEASLKLGGTWSIHEQDAFILL